MVRALHAAGIEVILDIVFNHSAEGNELGPTLCFRGLDNSIYYMLDERPALVPNYSGCGNTMNCNHPILRTFIWTASTTGWSRCTWTASASTSVGPRPRQEGASWRTRLSSSGIAEDPILRQTKIIAEAWDAAGAYQVGWFPGGGGRSGTTGSATTCDASGGGTAAVARPGHEDRRLATSTSATAASPSTASTSSLPTTASRSTTSSPTSASTTRKTGRGTGRRRRELLLQLRRGGPDGNAAVEAVAEPAGQELPRHPALSLGTPMLLGGDEFRRTQGGNNNA